MLDLHAVVGTPGAIGTLTKLATLIPTDGLNTVGVPVKTDRDAAKLIMWGSMSLLANTIAETQLIAQDCIDPRNGEYVYLGSASLKNSFKKFTYIPYNTGSRDIYQTTNTAQAANSLGITLDHYEPGLKVGECVNAAGLRFHENIVIVPQTLGVDAAIAWKNTAFAPTNMLPSGKYALLGFTLAKTTVAHAIRFAHADFGFCLPGIQTQDHFATIMTGGAGMAMLDPIELDPGFQFVALSELSGKATVPTFKIGPAATGLTIQSLAPTATDTPVVTPYLVKLSD